MHELTLLGDILILVAFAIPAVALAARLKLPPIVAFLIAGIVIGPYGLRLISHPTDVAELAELGVVLLLFEIGLEVSLARIAKMGSALLVGGGLQVTLTIAAAAALGVALRIPLETSIVYGSLLALSSTAIVLKVYRDRDEIDTPHGRIGFAILLFQDLAVVPLMVLVSVLGATGGASVGAAMLRIGVSLGVVVGIVLAGRLLVPWVLERVVGVRNREVFTLAIAFFGLGAAFVTASVGLSLALGAFLAGLVISESEYGAQAVSDVIPFRALFSGVFFTSMGMLLDLPFVLDHLLLVGGVAVGAVVGKATIVASISRWVLRRSAFASVLAGLGLAQVGEFSFVLAGTALVNGSLSETAYQVFLATAVLSMLATPVLIERGRTLGAWLTGRGRAVTEAESGEPDRASGLTDHAIIVGYGLGGRRLARVLSAAHLPYIVLEVNGHTVQRARAEGERIEFGDGTRREVLLHAGIRGARAVVFSIGSPIDERRGVSIARELSPTALIAVRTRTVDAIPDLERRGADDVVVEEFEAALELFQRVLRHYRIPANTIATELDAMRAEHYGILRGVPTQALHLDDLRYLGIHHALELVEVEPGSAAVDANPASLELRSTTGATVVAVVREGVARYEFDDAFRFAPGDTVVLVGPSPAILKGAGVFRAATAAHVD